MNLGPYEIDLDSTRVFFTEIHWRSGKNLCEIVVQYAYRSEATRFIQLVFAHIMSSKRVHCTVEGLDDSPTVKIVDLDLSPPKAPKPPKRRKAAPRTTTFQVAGSLPSILDPVVAQASKLELGDNKLPDTDESHSTPPIDPADFDPFIDAPTAFEDEGEMSESDETTAFKKVYTYFSSHLKLTMTLSVLY